MANESSLALARLPILGPRARLIDVVHEALRDAIAGGVLPPGTRLREAAIAQQYGVSVTPVREAMRRLEREGLVAVSPHRGAMVSVFTARDIANLYEIHEVLQCRAARHAAAAAHCDFAALEALLAAMAAVLDEPDQREFNRLDLAFHRAINDMGGNPQLADLIEQTHRRILSQRIRLAVHLPGRPALSHAQHHELFIAVRTGDADRAEMLTRAHIRSVRDAVVRLLEDGMHEGAA